MAWPKRTEPVENLSEQGSYGDTQRKNPRLEEFRRETRLRSASLFQCRSTSPVWQSPGLATDGHRRCQSARRSSAHQSILGRRGKCRCLRP